MRRTVLFVLIAAVVAAGLSALYTFRPNATLNVGGVERTFTIHAPQTIEELNKDVPVLLILHGNPSKSWQLRAYTGMNKVANAHDFIVVYADALHHRWPFVERDEIRRELDYIGALMDHVIKNYPIDPRRVYMSGISGGGIFSCLVAQEMPDRIAAVAVVAGNLPRSIDIDKLSPTPFLLFHGTEDFIYGGREDLYSAEESVEIWRRINKCQPEAVTVNLPDKVDDATTTEVSTWTCEKTVTFYKIHGGGHHWPGADFNADNWTKLNLGNFPRDFTASEAIWDFVSEFSTTD